MVRARASPPAAVAVAVASLLIVVASPAVPGPAGALLAAFPPPPPLPRLALGLPRPRPSSPRRLLRPTDDTDRGADDVAPGAGGPPADGRELIPSVRGVRTFRGRTPRRRRAILSRCDRESCAPAIRERVAGKHNRMEFSGPATGQVAYGWANGAPSKGEPVEEDDDVSAGVPREGIDPPTVLMLVKRGDSELEAVAADAVRKLTSNGVRVLLDPELAAKMKYYQGVDDDEYIALFDPHPPHGGGLRQYGERRRDSRSDSGSGGPDLICTLGGDGLLMHASSLFPGAIPPILCVAGGSMGFLTPFSREEMVEAIRISLGLYDDGDGEEDYDDAIDISGEEEEKGEDHRRSNASAVHMDVSTEGSVSSIPSQERPKFHLCTLDPTCICLSMRMRLDCRILNREGVVRARFSVLNEVVIDRGSSPYLAALECYCDDIHLTTVQADGVIFSTPTGSTAYSMAAGGSVVHPAVPAILVTPICPHVLSFRPMILPDHVVLRCYVPDDARSDACVAFDGKHRRELRRGDSVMISMSAYPVPTINRMDHSSDWLNSLKRNFNFNSRVRQNPL